MKRLMLTIALALMLTAMVAPGVNAEEEAARPKVEVVFVLDTTGSMSSLIEGAKVKVWKIVNQIVSGDPRPDVRVALVAYRDRGDTYVTQHTALSTDLDSIYNVLKGFTANGGGDTPESVNQALSEGLTKTEWSKDERVLKLIYLVGDAPPKMNYQDDVKYTVTCEAAARAGVIINTVQCGGHGETTKVWQEIARKAEGRFVQIAQSGGMAAVETPFDARLAALSDKLGEGAVFYGDAKLRRAAKRSLAEAEETLDAAPAEAKAERAGYLGKAGRLAASDLVGLLESGELKIEDVEEDKLPEDIQKLAPPEREAHLAELVAERKAVRAELLELDAKRAEFIKAELEKAGAKGDAFDEKVLDALREQAGKIGVKYE